MQKLLLGCLCSVVLVGVVQSQFDATEARERLNISRKASAFTRIRSELNLTEEQTKKIVDLEKKLEPVRKKMTELSNELRKGGGFGNITPELREKMSAVMNEYSQATKTFLTEVEKILTKEQLAKWENATQPLPDRGGFGGRVISSRTSIRSVELRVQRLRLDDNKKAKVEALLEKYKAKEQKLVKKLDILGNKPAAQLTPEEQRKLLDSFRERRTQTQKLAEELIQNLGKVLTKEQMTTLSGRGDRREARPRRTGRITPVDFEKELGLTEVQKKQVLDAYAEAEREAMKLLTPAQRREFEMLLKNKISDTGRRSRREGARPQP